MNRRGLLGTLAGTGAGALLAGCLGDEPNGTGRDENGADSSEDDDSRSDDAETDDGASDDDSNEIPAEPSGGTCGPADEDLEALLTDDPGGGPMCPEGMYPTLVIENTRDERIVALVELDGVETVEAEVELEPGERAVPGRIVPTTDGLEVTVTVEGDVGDGEPESEGIMTGSWKSRSCRRHAILVGDDDIETGYVSPLSGPGDVEHDCYAGDRAGLRIYNEYVERTVTVLIDDRCAGTRRTEEVPLGVGDVESISDGLVSGGVYDVTVLLEDGTSETYEFHEECWGVSAGIDEQGEIGIHQMAID